MMLGSMRFILSILVALYHIPVTHNTLNLGVVSVVVFYFTSGYLMCKSFGRFQQHSVQPIRAFLADRAIKLLPLYWLVLLITCICTLALGSSNHVLFMGQELTFAKIIGNIALLPTNYVFQPLVIESVMPHPLIPPAWSLASEFHFYVLVPLLALLGHRHLVWPLLATTLTSIAAMTITTDTFGADALSYRFIFGSGSYFLLGYCFAASEKHKQLQWQTRIVWFTYIALFMTAMTGLFETQPFILEVMIGAVVSYPIFRFCFGSRALPNQWQPIDQWLGRLAYPVFICHMLCFYIAEGLGISRDNSAAYVLNVMLLTLCMAAALALLQSRIDQWRVRKRRFDSMNAF